MGRALLLSILFVANAVMAAGAAPDVAADPVLEARVNAISAELRCLVCQNQSLADSHAELALQLKGQVREQLQAGRNEQQVVAYMTQRYGDFVLYRPPFKATTVLLWAGPGLLLAIGIGVLAWNLRRKAPANELSETDAARAASLLDRG